MAVKQLREIGKNSEEGRPTETEERFQKLTFVGESKGDTAPLSVIGGSSVFSWCLFCNNLSLISLHQFGSAPLLNILVKFHKSKCPLLLAMSFLSELFLWSSTIIPKSQRNYLPPTGKTDNAKREVVTARACLTMFHENDSPLCDSSFYFFLWKKVQNNLSTPNLHMQME